MGVLTKKTKLISARIPLDLADDLEDYLKGESLTKFIVSALVNELKLCDRYKSEEESYKDEIDLIGGCSFDG